MHLKTSSAKWRPFCPSPFVIWPQWVKLWVTLCVMPSFITVFGNVHLLTPELLFWWYLWYIYFSSEMKRIHRSCSARACMLFPNYSAAKTMIFLTMTSYVLTGHALSAELVFMTITMMQPLQLSLTLFVPFAVTVLAECKVSVSRIQVRGLPAAWVSERLALSQIAKTFGSTSIRHQSDTKVLDWCQIDVDH